jgi:hypothetical protein
MLDPTYSRTGLEITEMMGRLSSSRIAPAILHLLMMVVDDDNTSPMHKTKVSRK